MRFCYVLDRPVELVSYRKTIPNGTLLTKPYACSCSHRYGKQYWARWMHAQGLLIYLCKQLYLAAPVPHFLTYINESWVLIGLNRFDIKCSPSTREVMLAVPNELHPEKCMCVCVRARALGCLEILHFFHILMLFLTSQMLSICLMFLAVFVAVFWMDML